MRLTSPQILHARQLIRVCLTLLVFASVRLGGQPLPDRPGGSRPVALTKPRITPLPEAQWTDEHKQRIAKFLPAGARPGNSFRTLLNVPELVDRTMTLYNYVTQVSSLPPRIRERSALDVPVLRTRVEPRAEVRPRCRSERPERAHDRAAGGAVQAGAV